MPEKKVATIWSAEELANLKQIKLFRNGERQPSRFQKADESTSEAANFTCGKENAGRKEA